MAQSDAYPGTWQMKYKQGENMPVINIELKIANAEKNILYPASLLLYCDSFNAAYQLLLVKKNSRELGISKNKYPVFEKPFSLGNNTMFLNGILDFGRDLKGLSTLTIKRLLSKKNATVIPDTTKLNKQQKLLAAYLLSALKDGDIVLYKTNGKPWKDDACDKILSSSISPAYFGLMDTVFVNTRDGMLHLSGNKKDDVVAVSLNGQTFIDQLAINKKTHSEDILLDTGLNTIVFFAENFGNDLPNKGKLIIESGTKKINLDFNKGIDSAASFIVAKLFCLRDKDKDIGFRDYSPTGVNAKPLKENEKLLGSIVSVSQQLTLAVWDDAVEDGDSISISINGKQFVKGFPVKKNPQFLTISLKPGPNSITFMADNLGSIPPNTAVLEIIDGKKRRSFMLETTIGENNLIKILYDLEAKQQ